MQTFKLQSKTITNKEDLDFIFNTTEEQCCSLSFMMQCFGEFNNKRRFNPYDIIVVPPDTYGPEGKKNKKAFTTTIGIFIFNKAFIEKDLLDIIGYINEPINNKLYSKINTKISYAVVEDKIKLQALKDFLLKTQKFQPYCNILSWSFTPKMLNSSTIIKKKKAELIEKYKEELGSSDDVNPDVVQKIEKELLAETKKELKEDPSMNMIDSGAKISFGNNYKKMFVMSGTTKRSDPSVGDYLMVKGNYVDGISKEDYANFADSLIGGPYSRAVKTEVGGALEKEFVRAFQHIIIGPENSDCHTKRTMTVNLTDNNIKDWMYNYIVEGDNLIELTSDNMDKYINKTVKFRFCMMCEDPQYICNKCAGNLFNRLGIKNIGIATYIMCSVIKNISMKAFHDSTVKISKLSDYGYDKIFGLD